VTIARGAIYSTAFYSRETVAGVATLTATNRTSVIRRYESVVPAAAVRELITPASLRLAVGRSYTLTATARDRFGNRTRVAAKWSLSSPGDVHLSSTHTRALIVRALKVGSVHVTASWGSAIGRSLITVVP
jgi:hypothetical protein